MIEPESIFRLGIELVEVPICKSRLPTAESNNLDSLIKEPHLSFQFTWVQTADNDIDSTHLKYAKQNEITSFKHFQTKLEMPI